MGLDPVEDALESEADPVGRVGDVDTPAARTPFMTGNAASVSGAMSWVAGDDGVGSRCASGIRRGGPWTADRRVGTIVAGAWTRSQ